MFDPKIVEFWAFLSEMTPDLPAGTPNLSEHWWNQSPLSRHFPLKRKVVVVIWNLKQVWLLYTGICHGPADFMVKHNRDNPDKSSKISTRLRGLVRTWTWPPCPGKFSCPSLDSTCIQNLHQPNRPFFPSSPPPLGPKWPNFVQFISD